MVFFKLYCPHIFTLIFLVILMTACADNANSYGSPDSAFYVSPAGSDRNSGRSPDKPFQTLEKAQKAMRAAGIKTTYLMGGTYSRSGPLNLTNEDAGGSWLAYAGQVPVLDGGKRLGPGILVRADHIRLQGLTVQNFNQRGIFLDRGAKHVIIEHNTVRNIPCDAWIQGGILLGAADNAQVSHNLVENVGYIGIGYGSPGTLNIEYNIVRNVCLSVKDCGAIYVIDREHKAKSVNISNNVISNYGNNDNSNSSKAIYLDDQLSNATVKNNIIYGVGTFAIQFHGGDHNVVKNNIFDITEAYGLGFYQDDGPKAPRFGMANNLFTCNIVYTGKHRSGFMWINHTSAAEKPLKVAQNMYWSAKGQMAGKSDFADQQPMQQNPNFVNPTARNYDFTAGEGPDFCDFEPINSKLAGPKGHH
jgi:hypothetical protein